MPVPLKRRGQLQVEVGGTAPPELAEALTTALGELVEVFDKAHDRAAARAGLAELEVECVLGFDPDGAVTVRDGTGGGLFRVRMTWTGRGGPNPPSAPGPGLTGRLPSA